MRVDRRALLLLSGTALGARSAPGRALVAPMAPTGAMVRLQHEQPVGAIPELLREIGRRAQCHFELPVVPRARLFKMFFETGEADVLLPASRNRARDEQAQFVLLGTSQPTLVTLQGACPAGCGPLPTNPRELLAHSDWQAAAVRTHTFGDRYDELMRALGPRLTLTHSLTTVMRMLLAGHAQFTVLPPNLAHTELASIAPQALGRLRFQRLEGLPPVDVGPYLSTRTLDAATRERLADAVTQVAVQGVARRIMAAHHPPEVMAMDFSFRDGRG